MYRTNVPMINIVFSFTLNISIMKHTVYASYNHTDRMTRHTANKTLQVTQRESNERGQQQPVRARTYLIVW